MATPRVSRRRFIRQSAAWAGGLMAAPLVQGTWATGSIPTAADQVTLGNTGIKLSRLGMGCGSKGGSIQRALGQEGFTRLVRYAYDQGITYFDTAQSYQTHEFIRAGTQDLPREKIFIQSKMSGTPKNPLSVIERYCKELGTEYIDTLLVHCAVTPGWDEERKPVLDALEKAKDKQLIRAHGVSCHSLPALQRAVDIDFVDVHLVRLNPQGAHMDTPEETWNAASNAAHVAPVVSQVQRMRQKGRGVIGMKLIGDGDFTRPEDREKAIRYVMQSDLTDAVTIGFKSPTEIDEAIERINRAFRERNT